MQAAHQQVVGEHSHQHPAGHGQTGAGHFVAAGELVKLLLPRTL